MKSFEDKIDTLEWLSRYANFYSPENVYVMLTAYKEIYTGNDSNYRTAYIQCQHNSDAVFAIIGAIKTEINRMNGVQSQSLNISKPLSGNQGVMLNNETKIAFYLNIMEPLLVND